jgi:hypothetical protein
MPIIPPIVLASVIIFSAAEMLCAIFEDVTAGSVTGGACCTLTTVIALAPLILLFRSSQLKETINTTYSNKDHNIDFAINTNRFFNTGFICGVFCNYVKLRDAVIYSKKTLEYYLLKEA